MAEALRLTNRELQRLLEGLSALDGVVTKAGATTEVLRFSFEAKLAFDIALNAEAVERALRPYERARKSLMAQHGVVDRMEVTEATAPKIAAFLADEEALLEQEVTVEISPLKRTEVQKGNAIPPGVLRKLLPLLRE